MATVKKLWLTNNEETRVAPSTTIDQIYLDDGTKFETEYNDAVFLSEEGSTEVDWAAIPLTHNDLVDGLTSTMTTRALTANQGKVLNDKIAATNSAVSTNASNITTNATNISTLSSSKVDVSTYNTKMAALDTMDSTIKSELDTAISAVTTDTELLDIRVKADGTTATTAGNAVREQVSELKDDAGELRDIDSLMLNGGIVKYIKQFKMNATTNNDSGNVTYVYHDINLGSPVVDEFVCVNVGSYENVTKSNSVTLYFKDESGTTLSSKSMEVGRTIVNPPTGWSYMTLRLYPTSTGGLSDTYAIYNEISVLSDCVSVEIDKTSTGISSVGRNLAGTFVPMTNISSGVFVQGNVRTSATFEFSEIDPSLSYVVSWDNSGVNFGALYSIYYDESKATISFKLYNGKFLYGYVALSDIPETAKYVRFYVYNSSASAASDSVPVEFMLETGTTPSKSYVNHDDVTDSVDMIKVEESIMPSVLDECVSYEEAVESNIILRENCVEVGERVNNDNNGNTTYIYHKYDFNVSPYETYYFRCESIEGAIKEEPVNIRSYSGTDQVTSVAKTTAQAHEGFTVNVGNATSMSLFLYPTATGGMSESNAEYKGLILVKDNGGEMKLNDLLLGKIRDMKVPDYYIADGYLDDKIEAARDLMIDAEGDYDTFFFITDMHWSINQRNSVSLIKYISERLNVPRLFNGGDLNDGINENCIYSVLDCFDGDIYNVTGNHEFFDTFYDRHGNQSTKTITASHIWHYLYGLMKGASVGSKTPAYYYIDNTVQCMRYIVLNSFNDSNSWELDDTQQSWLSGTALNMPSGYTAVIFTHGMYAIPFQSDRPLNSTDVSDAIESIVDSYSGDGSIACIIQGHTHIDRMTKTPGGVPVFVTTCDKNTPWTDPTTGLVDLIVDRSSGTIREQAFEIVVVDKHNRKVSLVRVGCPAQNGEGSSIGTEVEVRAQTY